ncbi:hypothetical protein ABGI61_15425 [Rheinheimera sp. FR7-31]|uniref:hypothetical protein n=1 Tax=Rheinheimera fenheensis TaxID=3152295 RepID=UPI00325E83EA
MSKPFQRVGSKSNAQAGKDFELCAKKCLLSIGLDLVQDINIPVGINGRLKGHSFDLGCLETKVIVECKSHKWTSGDNVPSAKLTVWNEAMYYFLAAPDDFRKIMFVLRDFSDKRSETLAEYYIRTYAHLIPNGVEIWEYDDSVSKAVQLTS